MVTPLPCDLRHYFHTKCIEEWYSRKEREYCPLCKETFTMGEVALYNENFTELAWNGSVSEQRSEGQPLLVPEP